MSTLSSTNPKRDFYEVLEVDPKASDDDIKKAYRRIALVWHPDKNMHRLEEATERFKEIQAAYAVLSDENERSWYDRHKEDILGEGDVDATLVNLYKYFSSSAFSGFDDSKTGFYAVFADAFDKIIAEEERYSEAAASDEYPRFGSSTTSHPEVLAFYRFWTNYASRMHFSWCDEHNPLDAPNRFIRRAMEKENKGIRNKARRERTDDIRAFVAFCKRMDRRYISATLELKKQEEEKQTKLKEAAAAKAKAAAEEKARLAEAYAKASAEYHRELSEVKAFRLAEVQAMEEEEHRKRKRAAAPVVGDVKVVRVELSGDVSEESDVSEDEILVCELCNKTFRTMPALVNHEKSKKHIAAMRQAGVVEVKKPDTSASAAVEDELDAFVAAMEAENEHDAAQRRSSVASSESSSSSDMEESDIAQLLAAQDKTEASRSPSSSSSDSSAEEEDEDDDDIVAARFARLRMNKQPAKSATLVTAQRRDSSSSIHSSTGASEPDTPHKAAPVPAAEESTSKSTTTTTTTAAGNVTKTGKVRKPRRAAKKDGTTAPAPPVVAGFKIDVKSDFLAGGSKGAPLRSMFVEGEEPSLVTAGACQVCGERFDTRNKLFQHIKKTGHAALKEGEASTTKKKGRR